MVASRAGSLLDETIVASLSLMSALRSLGLRCGRFRSMVVVPNDLMLEP
jgi:hypothetical protein